MVPIGHSPDYDLVADFGAGLIRIQCKTSSVFGNGRWDVTTCTRGGNQSWNGMVKRLESARYDQLFVLVADGRRWLIPSDRVEGGCGVRLGGPKYQAFEIETGRPLGTRPPSLH